MTGVKICGIRREEDIIYINKYMPDYVGFVFAESKRRVSPETVSYLCGTLNKTIKRVGVFVNESIDMIIETANLCKLDIVQLHGDEAPEYIKKLRNKIDSRIKIWKAIRIKDKESLNIINDYEADKFVLDTYAEGVYGGAGKTFDWRLAAESKNNDKLILAGGINIKNVSDAIKAVLPFAIDVSSGVESDGYKDEMKIKELIYSVRYNSY